jgi:hypothetical protein
LFVASGRIPIEKDRHDIPGEEVKLTLALIVCGVPITAGQPSVTENKETSLFGYVAAAKGSGSNAGTLQAPFKALTRGVNLALARTRTVLARKPQFFLQLSEKAQSLLVRLVQL